METIQAERKHRPFRRMMGAAASALLVIAAINPTEDAHAHADAQIEAFTHVNNDPGCIPGVEVTHGNSEGTNRVAISLDDGPGKFASAMEDVFDANGASGNLTQFLVVDQIRAHPDWALEIAARTKDVGNHSETHPDSATAIAAEMGPAQRDIQAFLGIMPRYARPPYLTKGAVINQAMAAEGLCDVLISVDSRDSAAPVVSKDIVCANFEQIKGNDIVLIHDNKLQTYLAVRDCLFPILNSKGLIAVSLHELFTGVLDNDTIVPAGGHVEIKAGAPGQTVIGQLTVDGARGNGYLTAYPCSEGQPLASDLNYVRNEANANLLYVKLDEQGKFCVSTNGSATNIIYDQTAEVSSLELPVHKSERKYDSREGAGKLAAGHILRLKLAGPNQIVIGQITNDRAEQAGFVTAFNCDNSQPPTSNLNYVIGRPSSNRYHAQTNANGEVCFYSSGTTDLIIDQSAELEPSAMSFDTTRLVDTRASGNTLPDNGSISVAAGLPNQTIIGQLTVDREKGSGFATIYPCDKSLPTASNVNYAADRPRSSSIIASTDAIGKDCIYVNKGTDVIFDKVATAQWASHAPVRMLDTRTIPQ